MLTIAVCMKQVSDPEAPLSLFEIAADGRHLVPPPGTPPVLSTFDENALEAALKIKDTVGATITVLGAGNKLARPVFKKTIAAGADQLVLLEDEGFEDLDSNSTAEVLARTIEKLGGFDLVVCGRQAADTDAGLVGFGIACKLGIPIISLARKVEITGSSVRIERLLPDGYEVVEAALPVLVTASNEIGELRFPPMKAVIAAQKAQPTVWSAADLGLDLAGLRRADLVRFFVPERRVECAMMEGTPAEIARSISEIFLKARVV
jgi:electron transfer flavoprotein beta subunit